MRIIPVKSDLAEDNRDFWELLRKDFDFDRAKLLSICNDTEKGHEATGKLDAAKYDQRKIIEKD